MTEPTQKPKKISRRDAIKLLGAVTGATVLANLPSKWSTPEIAKGVLPAHAQTSSLIHTLLCNQNQGVAEPDSNQYTSGVTINPASTGIVMRWTLTLNNVALDNGADPITGTDATDGSGFASVLTPAVTIVNPALNASVMVTWSFENASDGSGTCDQVFAYTVSIVHTLSCALGQSVGEPDSDQYSSSATITPNTSGIVMRWTLTLNNVALDNGADPITGTDATDGSGIASVLTPAVTIVNPAVSASLTVTWSFENVSDGTGTCDQIFAYTAVLPIVQTVSIIPVNTSTSPSATFNGNVISVGSTPLIAQGFAWDFSPNNAPETSDHDIPFVGTLGVGAYSVGPTFVSGTTGAKFGRAYAQNSVGIAYGDPIAFSTGICLAEGTLVTMADGTSKKIEDIDYSDWIRVWNFDEGTFDVAQSLWIKKAETVDQYNLVEFSDGSFIKTINDHRIFNKEKGMFTYPVISDDTPIGTTTFNVKGEEVTLIRKSVVNEQVNFYNVITNHHINLFTNGILTSCRYNNIYPIVDMKFVKDDRVLISQEAYSDIPNEYYEGLRLAEQKIPVGDTIHYVNRLEMFKAQPQDLIKTPNQFEVVPVL